MEILNKKLIFEGVYLTLSFFASIINKERVKCMKKVMITIAKVIAGILGSLIGFLALCCLVTLMWGGVQTARGTVTQELPVVAADFVPTVRIVAFTDTHNENENVADAVDTAYAMFDKDSTYAGVDAFFGLGDFTSVGGEDDFRNYAAVLNEHVREETVCINVLGNHEMKADNAEELFVKYFGHETNTVTDVKGFTCIGFSGERSLTEWTFTPSSLTWLSREIHAAEETAGDKPIFVFQHPHPFGTVYGSSLWCTPQLNPVFAGHSKVINFSGHSHFPMNDPRSINQTTYTSVGVGAMARFELDKNYIVGQHPERYEDAAQFCVIEADDSGRVRIRGYDLLSDSYFCDYFIENVNDRDTFAYTYKNMKAHDGEPVFAEDAVAQAARDENGNYRITFTEATAPEGFIVHEYIVKIKDADGKTVYKDTFLADYYIVNDDPFAGFTVGGDILQSGAEYTLSVTAESAYRYTTGPISLPLIIPE